MIRLFVTVFLLCIANPFPAYALQALSYSDELPPSARLKISAFLKGINYGALSDFTFSSTDLNGDNINEYIIKEKQCGQIQCLFLIIAEKKDDILLLSKIRAKHIMLGGTKSHGIFDILAFENELNDYDFDIYVWSPEEKKYMIKNDE